MSEAGVTAVGWPCEVWVQNNSINKSFPKNKALLECLWATPPGLGLSLYRRVRNALDGSWTLAGEY